MKWIRLKAEANRVIKVVKESPFAITSRGDGNGKALYVEGKGNASGDDV